MKVSKFTLSREVREVTITFVVADDGVIAQVFSLPKDARIIGWVLNIKEAFNDSTGTNMSLGTDSTDNVQIIDEYAIDATAAGTVWLDVVDSPGYEKAFAGPIYGDVTGETGDGTTGEVDVTCLFSIATGTKIN